jgi:hypothetical protein
MDDLLGSVAHDNIGRLVDSLCGSNDARQQKMYRSLLIQEQNRFASDEAWLKAMRECLMVCSRHISGQRKLINWLAWRGEDTALAEDLLNSMLSIRRGFIVQIEFRLRSL